MSYSTIYVGKYYKLIYYQWESALSMICDGIMLKVIPSEYEYSDKYYSKGIKFKNLIFERDIPFEERLRRAVTEGTEEVMRLDDIKIKKIECDTKCLTKIEDSIRSIKNGN